MLKLKKFLCGCFGFLALAHAFVIVIDILSILHRSHASSHASINRLIVIAMASVSGIVFGMAWWTNRNGKPGARGWGIAASLILILVLSLPLLLAGRSLTPRFFFIYAVFLATGVAGVVAFARPGAHGEPPLYAPKPRRCVGDGTSRLMDGIAGLLQIAGCFVGTYWWDRWGRAHGLPFVHGLLWWIVFLAVVQIAITAPELGHAVVGRALGMRLRAFVVGPFHWRIRDGVWRFQFLPKAILSGGGAAGIVPTDPDQSRWNEICMIAAGPGASLFTAVIAFCAALTAKGQPWEQAWEPLALLTTISLVMFAANLIPFRPQALYSDGARIYQILRGGPLADLHRVFNIAASTLVTPLRPRNFDIQAIQRAACSFTDGHQALVLRLIACEHFLDCGKLPEACDALVEAESVYRESASDIPVELHTGLIFGSALLRRDASSARLLWDTMVAKKPSHLGVDYWLAQSALHWVENSPKEAREAWDKGNILAQRLPAAGAFEFDRYRYTLLGQALNATPAGD
jgi:Peptidase family M50